MHLAKENALGITCKKLDFPTQPITTFQDYVYCLFQTLLGKGAPPHRHGHHILELDVSGKSGFQLHASRDDMDIMFREGEEQALTFLKKIL